LWRAHGLQVGQFEVNTPARHEVAMPPLLYNLALVKHVDDIRMLDCAKAMRNGNRRAPLGG
jgi:hypothetical protein